jgi:hypothetical protein
MLDREIPKLNLKRHPGASGVQAQGQFKTNNKAQLPFSPCGSCPAASIESGQIGPNGFGVQALATGASVPLQGGLANAAGHQDFSGTKVRCQGFRFRFGVWGFTAAGLWVYWPRGRAPPTVLCPPQRSPNFVRSPFTDVVGIGSPNPRPHKQLKPACELFAALGSTGKASA